jgi:hypothetical protein
VTYASFRTFDTPGASTRVEEIIPPVQDSAVDIVSSLSYNISTSLSTFESYISTSP